MFTEIISYAKMISKNEKKTLSLLEEHNLLLNDHFTKHSGNVIKETGDGYYQITYYKNGKRTHRSLGTRKTTP